MDAMMHSDADGHCEKGSPNDRAPSQHKKATDNFLSVADMRDLIWWRFRDSNPGPADYDSVALTG